MSYYYQDFNNMNTYCTERFKDSHNMYFTLGHIAYNQNYISDAIIEWEWGSAEIQATANTYSGYVKVRCDDYEPSDESYWKSWDYRNYMNYMVLYTYI